MAWHRHTSLTNFSRVGVRRRLCFASSHELSVPRTRLSTYGNRAFPVAAVRIWNSLPQHITPAPSLPVFCSRLKTYFFELCVVDHHYGLFPFSRVCDCVCIFSCLLAFRSVFSLEDSCYRCGAFPTPFMTPFPRPMRLARAGLANNGLIPSYPVC